MLSNRETTRSVKPIYPVERLWLSFLICVVTAISILLWKYGQGVPLYAVLLGYTVFFTCLRAVAARDHRRVAGVAVPQALPTVSVIVAAHNEERVVEGLVRNLSQLDYPDLQVLIVDDRSTDRTAEILRELQQEPGAKFEFYSRTESSKPGKASVLNEAIAKCNSEAIAIFDADARVARDYLYGIVDYLNDPRVAAVQARKAASNGDRNLLTQCQRYEFALDGYMQAKRDTIYGAVELRGNGMLIRREALDGVNGFNENNLTEDLDLSTRLHLQGWDLRYAADVQVFEEAMPELRPLMKQRLRWTEGSLIRYLEYGKAMLLSQGLAFRTKLDMMQFVFQCILPVWMLVEVLGVGVSWVTGKSHDWPSLYAIPATIVLSVYFFAIAVQGVARFEKTSVLRAFRGGALVYWFLSSLWVPIVCRVLFGIMTRKQRNLVWVKTEHFG